MAIALVRQQNFCPFKIFELKKSLKNKVGTYISPLSAGSCAIDFTQLGQQKYKSVLALNSK